MSTIKEKKQTEHFHPTCTQGHVPIEIHYRSVSHCLHPNTFLVIDPPIQILFFNKYK